MNILIISSSLNPQSLSRTVCKETESLLKSHGVNTDFLDLQDIELVLNFRGESKDLAKVKEKVAKADAFIFGMSVYNYTMNNSLKVFLDTMFKPEKEYALFGIICGAGGDRSYLATMHLTQTCQNQWRMMEFPRNFYCTKRDIEDGKLKVEMQERLEQFTNDFVTIGKKLLR